MRKQIIYIFFLLCPLINFSQSHDTAVAKVVKIDTINYLNKAVFIAKWIMITGPKDELHDYITIHDTLYDCEISVLKMNYFSKSKYKAILYNTYLKSNKKWVTYLPCFADTNSASLYTIIPVEKIGTVKIKKSIKCE